MNNIKKLFEISSRAYELLNNSLAIDKYDRIMEIISELKDYTVFHFSQEEEYLIKNNYKKLLSHKIEHDAFIRKFAEIDLNKVEYQQDAYILDILEFLSKWIIDHILIRDKHYSETIKKEA
ncbi:hypothetical protein M918_12615 [Clostridium sp. BL8]|nr:hypothetical protein M918_12615 [Clostridium sp. BL8]